jgi:aerobic carbon-monoxide dehydrogenase large subunit
MSGATGSSDPERTADPGLPARSGNRYVGTAVPRREDERMLAGHGRFLADLSAGALHVAFVRSSHASALIEGIDVSAALALPGVLGAYTGADLGLVRNCIGTLHEPHPTFVAATGFAMADQRLAVLPVDRVSYVGQPVVAVVATDRYCAEDAVEAVDIRYAPLPPVLDPEAALAPGCPTVHPHLPDNEAATIAVDFGDVEAAAALAAVTVQGTYRVGRHGAVPLEGRGVLARVERNRLALWTSTQIPHLVRRGICDATGWATDELRVVVPDVGGGFGAKANVYAEEIVVAALARITDRDLVWSEDRQEHLVSCAQGRDQVHSTRLSVDGEGRILGWEDEFVVDIGAGSLWVAGVVANTAIHLLGPYRVPSARFRGRAAFTNKTIVAQYRGAGRPEACFALERSLDDVAHRLGLTPDEIRRRNLLTAADMPHKRPLPYRDGVPIAYDGGDYLRCLEAALELLPRAEMEAMRDDHPELALGYGVGCYIEATGRGPYETGRVRLRPSGRFEVASGAASAGQAHETVFAQVAAEALDVPLDDVTFLGGDTGLVEHGIGTFASRSAVLAGSAVRRASDELLRRGHRRAAKLLGVPSGEVAYRDGVFTDPRSPVERSLTWADVAEASAPGGPLESEGDLDVTETFRPRTVTWTMGAHTAVVGVHRRTGAVSVLRYAVAHEGGAEINPQVVEGQVIGGVAQGIGGALLEEFRYSDDGQPQSTTFAEYRLPGSCEVPDVRVKHLPVATPENPLGVRGAGESGAIAVGAALASAVDDAVGRQVAVTTPVSPSLLRTALLGEAVPRAGADGNAA